MDSQHWIKLLSWPSQWTALRNLIRCSQRYFPSRHKGKTSSSTSCYPGVVPWVLTSLSLCSEKSHIRQIPGQEASSIACRPEEGSEVLLHLVRKVDATKLSTEAGTGGRR